MPYPGDKVKVVTKDQTVEGILMPSFDEEAVLVKLDSGYNFGFKKKDVTKITLMEKAKEKNIAAAKSLLPVKDLLTISILHTGGTIASKVDYQTGGVGAYFKPEELVALFPELKQIANVKSRLIKNMWSQDMRFSHYNLIAKEIKKELEAGAEGVIVTQGTDTLHYTAAALAFILEGLTKPVMIVGAQRSSDRGSSDAFLNVVNAAYFITHSDFGEVGICMHGSSSDDTCVILPATKTMKLHTSRRDAFKAVNTAPWANVDYAKQKVEFVCSTYRKKSKLKNLTLRLFKEDIKVGIIKQHTNMYAEQFLFYKNYDGVIIESTGLGCLPITKMDDSTQESENICKAITALIQKGVIVVEAPQTIFGRLNLNVYEDQRRAQQIGVLGNGNDMTPATTFIKLAWLLSNYPREEVMKLLGMNLRGEINKQLAYEPDFLN